MEKNKIKKLKIQSILQNNAHNGKNHIKNEHNNQFVINTRGS